MQITPINNQNFTSVIPVKVIANGQEVLDEETIRKGCNALIRAIAGPIRENTNPVIRPAAATLSTMDPHYNYFLAYTSGYKNIAQDSINSDYFKTIMGRSGGYIVTGPRVQEISSAGYEIGSARKECRNYGLANSDRLNQAYVNYQKTIANIGNDINERLSEIFDRKTGKRLGKHQQIELHITTKNVKRNNKNSVTVKSIDDVQFKDR